MVRRWWHATNCNRTWHNCSAVERFRDYGPNGLQVEGRAEVRIA